MFNELYLFFQNHINGIMYIMLFFVIFLFFGVSKFTPIIAKKEIKNKNKRTIFKILIKFSLKYIISGFVVIVVVVDVKLKLYPNKENTNNIMIIENVANNIFLP